MHISLLGDAGMILCVCVCVSVRDCPLDPHSRQQQSYFTGSTTAQGTQVVALVKEKYLKIVLFAACCKPTISKPD